ncbi:MAG TPA: tryptophan 2,3-dioxygenase family protein [Steroidobacteraceae bacterium]|jgi:tryptophan 2,3-dioxygenase|nr:tryptophan 2,3-dioxygenase family protein [Steroidobacteraceae bacterium]
MTAKGKSTQAPTDLQPRTEEERRQLAQRTGGKPLLDLAVESVGTTPYVRYTRVDLLLSLQSLRSSSPDEMTFMIIGQTMELSMKLLSHELQRARQAICADDVDAAFPIMRRACRVLAYMTQAWDVISTITPTGYAAFRDHLGISSGFGSFMYREVEFLLGNKNRAMLVPHEPLPAVHARLTELLEMTSLYDEVIGLLARRGFFIDAAHLERDVSAPYSANASVEAAWLRILRSARPGEQLYQLGESLMEIAENFKNWRNRHYVTVSRLIGDKPGTGGTSGLAWLRAVAEQNFFPELWAARSSL